MAVPQTVQVAMYSNRKEAAAFLDGGLFDRQGYDNWIRWIVGTNSVRLVCARAGIAQPARLSGETSKPTVEQLEEELLRSDWRELTPQLDHLLTLA